MYSQSLRENDLNTAKSTIREAIYLAKDLKLTQLEGRSLLFLSFIETAEEDQFDSAISTALSALKLGEDRRDLPLIGRTHSQLSETYRLMHNSRLSEDHVKKFLEVANALQDKQMILQALTQLAVLYQETNQPEKEREFLNMALKMQDAQDNKRVVQKIRTLQADMQYDEKNYKESVKSYRQILSVSQNEKNYHGMAWLQTRLSLIFLELNQDSALYYARAALETSKQHGLKKELIDANDALFNYYDRFHDYKRALGYRIVRDSLFDEAHNYKLEENAERVRLQYEQDKKDDVARAQLEKKDNVARRARNLQLTAIAGFVLLASFLFWSNRQQKKSKTRIEKAFAALKAAQAQLVQSEKMASLGELTAGIAHEIQNPLNFVNNFSEINGEMIAEMKQEIDKGNYDEVKLLAKDIEENGQKITHHGKRAEAIVKSMLQHSRTGSGKTEPTDINALADEYLRLAYHGLRAKDKSFNAKIHTDLDKSIGNLNLVSQDIGRVFLNLINNAFYAVAEKKQQLDGSYEPTVSISTKQINNPLANGGNKIQIKVKDNGNGIPEKIANKIFQPFFTTKPTGQGTGLGLSLSHDIIKAHGGEIKVQTKQGEGSEFIIQLPIQHS
jgi:signal transduction histidine kinase